MFKLFKKIEKVEKNFKIDFYQFSPNKSNLAVFNSIVVCAKVRNAEMREKFGNLNFEKKPHSFDSIHEKTTSRHTNKIGQFNLSIHFILLLYQLYIYLQCQTILLFYIHLKQVLLQLSFASFQLPLLQFE